MIIKDWYELFAAKGAKGTEIQFLSGYVGEPDKEGTWETANVDEAIFSDLENMFLNGWIRTKPEILALDLYEKAEECGAIIWGEFNKPYTIDVGTRTFVFKPTGRVIRNGVIEESDNGAA